MALTVLKTTALVGMLALLGGCAFFGQPEVEVDFWQPALCPDGERLVYVAQGPDSYDLFILDLDSGDERSLTTTGHDELYPSWSPDGVKIAFMAMQDKDNWDIFTVEVDTGQVFRVTTDEALDVNPKWSATGEIVFNSDRDGDWGAYAIAPDGTGLRRLSFDRPQTD